MRLIILFCFLFIKTINAKGSKDEVSNEPVGACGPVPSNSIMMAALKPASKILMSCIDILNELEPYRNYSVVRIFVYPVRALILHDALVTLCENFEKCTKLGKGDPAKACFQEGGTQFLLKHKDDIPFDVNIASEKIFSCMLGNMPSKKLEMFSSIHWILLMLKS